VPERLSEMAFSHQFEMQRIETISAINCATMDARRHIPMQTGSLHRDATLWIKWAITARGLAGCLSAAGTSASL
jgi:hypothetical protein